MAYDFNPLPEPGDIVWARLPEVENLGSPGPKPRPAFVIGVSEEDHAIEVAYGTSKRTNRLYPGEFVLDPADGGFVASGLTGRTKFDVGRIEALPFDSDWFRPAPGVHINSPLPKLGLLHPSYMSKLLSARKQVT